MNAPSASDATRVGSWSQASVTRRKSTSASCRMGNVWAVGYDMSTTPSPSDVPAAAGWFPPFSLTIDENVRDPGHKGVHFVMTALTNAPSHDEFDELLGHALDDLDDATVAGYDVRADPVLAGY